MSDFAIRTREHDGVVLIEVSGFLDAHTFEQLQTALEGFMAAGKHRFAISLAKMGYISSAGAGVCIGALGRAQENGGDVVLVTPAANILEVFDLLGLTEIFTFTPTLADAVQHYKRR